MTETRVVHPVTVEFLKWVAARQRTLHSGELFPPPAIVINAGTAVTIDALDGDGHFLGGFIVPGLRLMLRTLAENTAALKMPPGNFTLKATAA